jgi:3-oxoadipate enol-lactonase
MVASVQMVVLVHAFGSSGRAWAPQVAGLGDRYRVIAPDLPGHGGAAGPFTLDRAVEAVRAVSADAGGVHLAGISGGATVALLTYLANPERVASVLSAGVAHAPRLVSLQRAIQRALPEPVLARLLRGWHSGGRREYEQVAAEDFRRCGKQTFLAAQRKLPICRELLRLPPRPRFRRTCRKRPRDVAVRRAYRRCVRNVSGCSTGRQQQSANLQAL